MQLENNTIGLIFPELVDFGAMTWGAFDAADRHGVNALCFQGNPLASPVGFAAQANRVYDFITRESPLDGLVLWTGWLGQFVGAAAVTRFCQRFEPLPMVSISQPIQGLSCVLGDNYQSMREIVRHLVEVHGCRRIAFVNGPPNHVESAQRYRGYMDWLRHYGRRIDPELVIGGQFTQAAGREAVRQLVEHRRVTFDAVITGDDFVALGVIEGLQARGIRVPEDVAVTGFDDTPHARATVPPLTTVRQSAYDQGYQGVDLLLAQLRGEGGPVQVHLPMRLVVRQSCGCSNPVVLRAVAPTQPGADRYFWHDLDRPRAAVDDAARVAVRAEIQTVLHDSACAIEPPVIDALLDAFVAELAAPEATAPDVFIAEVRALLHARIEADADLFAVQDVISAMRQVILPRLTERNVIALATNLWGQARVVIGETALRIQAQNHLKADQRIRLLREIGQELITTFDLHDLVRLVVRELPRLGIAGGWLARYADSDPAETPQHAYLLAAFEAEGEQCRVHDLPPGGAQFVTHRLAADWLARRQRPTHLVLAPLYFRDQQLGCVYFEPGPRDGSLYEALRGYLTTALYGALLFQHNRELYRQAVQARADAEKADQLKTQLLANVSHELRTPLTIILGYTRAALANPTQYGSALPAALNEDLEHIASSASYLSRMINDLLDLSRAEINELNLHPEIVDPRDLICTVFDEMTANLGQSGAVEWALDIPSRLPLIQADPDRVRQILLNLLTNAQHHTARGAITLGADVQPPYLRIWVQDTGSGIPADQQERIFEPFVTGAAGQPRPPGIGLGLSITRRLVSLHRGLIALESAPGQGSTFHVYLPLPSLSGTYVELSSTGQPTMLLLGAARDPGAVSPAVHQMAARQGWELLPVRPDADFHALLADAAHEDRARQLVAIAWDLEAASADEWLLAQRLRTHPQLCQLPLLLFGRSARSGSTGASDIAPADSRQPVTQVMVKPLGGETLLDAIARLLPDNVPGTVLAVDDDPQALAMYERLVQTALADYGVVMATSGAAAIQQLDAGLVPDLVILDLVMPPPDGFEVLDHLRARAATSSVPVLVLSGKMLTADDIQRLGQHDVLLHTKGTLADGELESVLRGLMTDGLPLDRQTSALVKRTLAHIHQHYDHPITRADLCRVLGISENYLSRLFRQEMGLSLVDYINRYRVHIAQHLLTATDQPVTAIAQQVGFDDPAYFSRVFTRYAGCSPRAYRQATTTGSPPDG